MGKIKESIEEQANKYERSWPIFEIINALLAAGLTLKKFEEHPHEYWKEFPHLSVKDRESFPNTFSLLVEKP